MKVYRVYDTKKKEYWETFKPKVWMKLGSAKNAWNIRRHHFGEPVFSGQTRFVIHTFTLIRMLPSEDK